MLKAIDAWMDQVKKAQATLAVDLVKTPVASHEAYREKAGLYQGLEQSLRIMEEILSAEER